MSKFCRCTFIVIRRQLQRYRLFLFIHVEFIFAKSPQTAIGQLCVLEVSTIAALKYNDINRSNLKPQVCLNGATMKTSRIANGKRVTP